MVSWVDKEERQINSNIVDFIWTVWTARDADFEQYGNSNLEKCAAMFANKSGIPRRLSRGKHGRHAGDISVPFEL